MLVRFAMKCTAVIPICLVLGLSACDTMTSPITSGDFDPLGTPGSNRPTLVAGSYFTAGQFVRAAINNTAFYNTRPKGERDADKLLLRGTSMKVISHSDSYVKVELDSGEIGFVPSVMLEDPNAAPTPNGIQPGEFQVYPPVGPDGLPLPVPAGEQPPEGSIPTVIDPDAPAVTEPFRAPDSEQEPKKEPDGENKPAE